MMWLWLDLEEWLVCISRVWIVAACWIAVVETFIGQAAKAITDQYQHCAPDVSQLK